MIWAALAAIIAASVAGAAGGHADMFAEIVKQWRRYLRKYVDDKKTRETAIAILDQFEKDVKEIYRQVGTELGALSDVHTNHASTMAEYEAKIVTLESVVTKGQRKLVDHTFAMEKVIGPQAYDRIQDQVRADMDERDRKRAKKKAKEDKKAARRGS